VADDAPRAAWLVVGEWLVDLQRPRSQVAPEELRGAAEDLLRQMETCQLQEETDLAETCRQLLREVEAVVSAEGLDGEESIDQPREASLGSA
jgi:hypothetical protein